MRLLYRRALEKKGRVLDQVSYRFILELGLSWRFFVVQSGSVSLSVDNAVVQISKGIKKYCDLCVH